jgi:type IV pilus assembly protein PilM
MAFGKKQDVIGLDIGTSAIKLVHLRPTSKGYQLVNLGIAPIPPQTIVEGSIMDATLVTDAIRGVMKERKVKVRDVAMAVSGHSVIVKKISIPETPPEELAESIRWEAEQHIPFDIEEVNLDYQVLDPDETTEKGKMNVLLVAAKREIISEYTSLVVDAGLHPVIVDLDVFALENAYEISYELDSQRNIALVDMGSGVTNINILKGGVTSFTRDLALGGSQFNEIIQKELGVGYEEAENLKSGRTVDGVDGGKVAGIIESVMDGVAGEIQRSIEFFKATSGQQEVHEVVLSGGCALMPQVSALLQKKLNIPVTVANPFRMIASKRFEADYLEGIGPLMTVAVGLALRRVGDK